MDPFVFEKLHAEGLISDSSFDKIKQRTNNPLFSIHWELKTILYLGVLLLSTGLGILIYQNIDYIGHPFVLIGIAGISAGGFFYCFKKKLPFSREKVESPDPFFDYILLLACLTFISFIGYWQYQYHIFGDRYGMLAFIPTLVLFFTAYFFDQLGILSLAITNLAAWAGIAITPTRILQSNDFNSGLLIVTGLVLGGVLVAASKASGRLGVKAHFAFTYINFGMNLLFISCLAGLFHFDSIYLLWFLMMAVVAAFFYWEANRQRSFYIVLMYTLYLYVGLSYVIVRLIFYTLQFELGGFFLTCLYFIGSGIGMIYFLMNRNKKLKKDDRI